MKEFLEDADPDSVKTFVLSILICVSVLFGACSRERRASSIVQATAGPVSVCDLIRSLELYQDKMVTVRGVYYFGLREESCQSTFVSDGRSWPSALDLVDSSFPADGDSAVSFATDDESWNKLDEIVIREARQRQYLQIWVTVVAQVRGPQRRLRTGQSRSIGGYGHLGMYPAQLVVKRIDNIIVRPTPTYDYRNMLPRGGRPVFSERNSPHER
jgi:hypothetical protein